MASKLNVFILACCFLATVAKASPYRSMCPNLNEVDDSDAKKVNVTLYYESLCPYCQGYIKEGLATAVKEIGSIMDLILLPYGNAQEAKKGGKYVFTCQHGPDECELNLLEACALHFKPNTTDNYPFIQCVESQSSSKWKSALSACESKISASASELSSCVTGPLGNKLMHEIAAKTGPHQGVPWPLVEGKFLEDRDKLIQAVCKLYQLLHESTVIGQKPWPEHAA